MGPKLSEPVLRAIEDGRTCHQGQRRDGQGEWILLCAGPVLRKPRLLGAEAEVIAVDGGIAHACSLGVTPTLWMGDWDSTDPVFFENLPELEIQSFPKHKDETDGELALKEALRRGATRIVMVGGCGGRTDHTLAHILLACGLKHHGIDLILTNGSEEIYPIVPGAKEVYFFPIGSTLSLIPLSPLDGACLSGVFWPLMREKIGREISTRTLSNQVIHEKVFCEVEAGWGVISVTLPEC